MKYPVSAVGRSAIAAARSRLGTRLDAQHESAAPKAGRSAAYILPVYYLFAVELIDTFGPHKREYSMPLSWNEIKDRALGFSKEWEHETSEDAEAKPFWEAFFNVFGVPRRRIASFEVPAKKLDGRDGYIDLLWRGVLLVEHKSRGKNLERAYKQAIDYFPGIKDRDLPQYVLVSDFERFKLYDLDKDETHEFLLKDLHKNARLFGFIAGYQSRSFGKEDPVNIEAAERLGKLHDLLRDEGYAGHTLEVLLVRLLFCLFAEDTGIFERGQFQEYLEQRTSDDGADIGMHLGQLFQVLNTPEPQRQRNLDEQLSAFPYVNGRLYAETLPLAAFNRTMREMLLDCCGLDWSRISPAVFGSLFQSIMDEKARRNLGAHYTTETNILKALQPLFLDSFRAEFLRARKDKKRLQEFHNRLKNTRVLDPACGCGNFLVIAYRELRMIELEVLREIYKHRGTGFLDIRDIVLVDVDQFYGIEIEEFPAQIAQVALWLMDHQMNILISEEFGKYFKRLPLIKSANIKHDNALTLEWRSVIGPGALSYIVGNPPFIGKAFQNEKQKLEVAAIYHDVKGAGVLDYVTCWYRKALDYMSGNTAIHAAFVSTNSITQGEQAGVLWSDLLKRGVKIHFAHRTFQWQSEAKGKAGVHCVIVGFGLHDVEEKWIFDYETPKSEPHAIRANNINPYLVDAPDVLLENRRSGICNAPPIVFGSMPNDGGHLLLSPQEKDDLVAREPRAKKWLRRVYGSDEFINNIERWCLWLVGIPPDELRTMPAVLAHVEAVRQYRLASKRPTTRELAVTPTMFGEIRQPEEGQYLLIPSVSSERRMFIPIGFMPAEVISTNLNLIVPHAALYHFGLLQSTMHMAWVRAVCGRLESRYRYSAGIVYNNYPWPEPNEKQRHVIESAAQSVLDVRANHPKSTLADLYDPLTMPQDLTKAHQTLDRAVDAAYGRSTFASEAERVAFLFVLYLKHTQMQGFDMPTAPGNKTRRKSSKNT